MTYIVNGWKTASYLRIPTACTRCISQRSTRNAELLHDSWSKRKRGSENGEINVINLVAILIPDIFVFSSTFPIPLNFTDFKPQRENEHEIDFYVSFYMQTTYSCKLYSHLQLFSSKKRKKFPLFLLANPFYSDEVYDLPFQRSVYYFDQAHIV